MKLLHIGCWGDFKRKYGYEVVAWARSEAEKKGIRLEDNTEVFYDAHNHAEPVIYFDKEAVKETIGCAVDLSKYWLKRKYAPRREAHGENQMHFYWAEQY